MKRRSAFDLAPLLVLLAFWATAGLASAITVAAADGGTRHLWLGLVTLPAIATVIAAMRRVVGNLGD